MSFHQAKWIWVDNTQSPDTYGEFFDTFSWTGKPVKCLLSCDSDYTLFINGNAVASNQYGDFEWYKSCDEIDITEYLREGENTIAVLVWYFGMDSQRHLSAKAGLIFELFEDGNTLLASGERTLSRYSLCYAHGRKKLVTSQLGLSFAYDATKEDGWQSSGTGFTPSVLVDKNCRFVARPIEKLHLLDRADAKIVASENNRYLIDLGKETVGLACLQFHSKQAQTITVAWGESLDDGHVRRIIAMRDFSFTYVAKEGENEYVNYMLRLGGRYLEIWCENPIEIGYIGMIPQVFPVTVKPFALEDELEQKIYDASVETLKNCMMEHYVDTPWREQCLYAYDSRNQMLCGYYAFEGGNIEYAKSNLKLIGEDRREDKLLSICSPCGADLTIPTFSLYYILALKEYLDYTGDKELIKELYPRILEIAQVFIDRVQDGLLCKFSSVAHWNFYDWSENLSSEPFFKEEAIPDAMINLLFILTLKNLKVIAEKIGETFTFDELLTGCKTKTKQAFFRQDKGLFELTQGGGEFSALVNALAVFVGITTQEESVAICEKMEKGELVDCSFSMKIFKYDAMLLTDKERWSGWVLSEIRKEYGKMIESGSSCVWETDKGSLAFGNAGSLCHGWSAIPVYYYHILKTK